MKLRTVLISVVVSASLVAGAGYGAYYALQGQQAVIEVVPVSNVNVGGYYWGMTDTVYGTVTSQISQRIELNEEYAVSEIFVEEGQKVTEGTPLFSYDMTLAELELEMDQLSLQTQELTKLRLEKELNKLKNTPATASLEANDGVLTASAPTEEAILDAEQTNAATLPEGGGSLNSESGAGIDIEIETMTEVEDPGLTQETEQSALKGVIDSYMLGINELFINLQQEDLSEAQFVLIDELLEQLVVSCHETLTDRVIRQETAEDGSVKEIVSRVLKEEVRALLDETEQENLEAYNVQLEKCQVRYIRLLMHEAQKAYGVNADAFEECVRRIRKEYDRLSTAAGETSGLLEQILELEEMLQNEAEGSTESENEAGTETGSEAGTENESESGSEAGTETESESGSEAGTENESESGSEAGTESESESGSEAGTESESETASESESETDTEYESETDTEYESETETESESEGMETESELSVEISGYINSFLELSRAVLAEDAREQPDYLIRLEDALVFYQQWVADPQDDILDEMVKAPKMSDFVLNADVTAYLEASGKLHLKEELESAYKEICMSFVQSSITSLNPYALVREDLAEAKEAYYALGESWQIELEQRWMEQQEGAALQQSEAQTEEMSGLYGDEFGEWPEETEAVYAPLTLAQTLQAYEMILAISELNPDSPEELLIPTLEDAYASYLALNESQKQAVWNSDILISLLQQYGLWEQESESEWQDDFGGFDDFGGWGDGYSYTAEELKTLIEDKEREIAECSLTIREVELSVEKRRRVVDNKVVKSTLDGVVVSIGGSDEYYFAEVTNSTGLYAKGVISELALESVNIGDTISGMSYENNMSFTAVIKEISEYPDPDGAYMSYGNGNTNAAYYPFYALIDNPEGIAEGDVEIQLSSSMESQTDSIYLENYFIRSGNDGKSYVFIQGEDGKLKKQIVETGKRMYSYATQVVSGLTLEDKIAFPYGKDVKEGASTEVVDVLQDAYM